MLTHHGLKDPGAAGAWALRETWHLSDADIRHSKGRAAMSGLLPLAACQRRGSGQAMPGAAGFRGGWLFNTPAVPGVVSSATCGAEGSFYTS